MLLDMSDDLSVKLYFGNGQIRYGEHGVDLSKFDSVDLILDAFQMQTVKLVLGCVFCELHQTVNTYGVFSLSHYTKQCT
jgi:hypothetical protein